ncbi:MAG TPA: sugar phosphate isomerase/epimerase [Chloroflexi bacterium]|jgi:sugar phosphate isomerase/epimerase|nr:sugar phosphate isomerase/epimerase [Chloroflexota bacterium]
MSPSGLAIGCCAGPADLAVLKTTPGLDFIELPVAKAMMGSPDEFARLVASMQLSALSARAVNVFLPATFKVVGPDSRPHELAEYATTALDRARQMGVGLLVFGSGASRTVPAGFSRDRAFDQFADAIRLVNQQASPRGVTLAVEPLHSEETNLLNSVGEAAAFLKQRRLDGVRLVADLWHMECEGEQLKVLDDLGDVIAHAHVAAAERRAPGQATDRIEEFLRHLRQAGYVGACSIECRWLDFATELPAAVARVREAAAAAGWGAA